MCWRLGLGLRKKMRGKKRAENKLRKSSLHCELDANSVPRGWKEAKSVEATAVAWKEYHYK
jgi:hypothetical protein